MKFPRLADWIDTTSTLASYCKAGAHHAPIEAVLFRICTCDILSRKKQASQIEREAASEGDQESRSDLAFSTLPPLSRLSASCRTLKNYDPATVASADARRGHSHTSPPASIVCFPAFALSSILSIDGGGGGTLAGEVEANRDCDGSIVTNPTVKPGLGRCPHVSLISQFGVDVAIAVTLPLSLHLSFESIS